MSVTLNNLVLYSASLMATGDGTTTGSGVNFGGRIGFSDVPATTTLLYVSSSASDGSAVSGIVVGRDGTGVIPAPETKAFNGTTPVPGTQLFQRLLSGSVSGSPVGDLAIYASGSVITGTAQSAANTAGTTAPQIVLQNGQGASVSIEQIVRITNNSPVGVNFQLRRIIAVSGDTASVSSDWATLPTSASTYAVLNGMLFDRLPNSVTSIIRLFVNTQSQAAGGSTNTYYSKFFAVNNNTATALTGASIGLVSTTPALPGSSTIQMGVAASFNDVLTVATRINSAPAGIVFTTGVLPVSQSVTSPGNLAPGSAPNTANSYGVWAQLTLPAGTGPFDGFASFTVSGATT